MNKSIQELQEEIESLKMQLKYQEVLNSIGRIFEYRKGQKLANPNSVQFHQKIFHQVLTYQFTNANVELEFLNGKPVAPGKIIFFAADTEAGEQCADEEVILDAIGCELFLQLFTESGLTLNNTFDYSKVFRRFETFAPSNLLGIK